MKPKGLPKGIVKLPNSDKDGRHHADSENPLMPYFPSVLIVCGKKGSGKTNLTLNLISKATPLYDRIVVVHGAGEASSEYPDLQALQQNNSRAVTCRRLNKSEH